MPSTIAVPVHEFYLQKFSDDFCRRLDYENENLEIYRVALGDLIPARERETYPPSYGSKSPDLWNPSGSVGFMDLKIDKKRVPKIGAHPLANFDYLYASTDCEVVTALIIQTIGIEPAYRRMGYGTFLKRRAEEIALKWGLDILVADTVENPIMRRLNEALGYILYDEGMYAVKRLNGRI